MSRVHDVEGARATHGAELVDRIIAAADVVDDDADRLVAAFRAMPGGRGWQLLDAALAGQDVAGAPPELEAVVRPALDPPSWVDLDLVDAGAVARWRISSATQAIALTCGSLAFGYRSAALSRPLAATGRLTQMAPRRLGETARWVVAATQPGALRPGAEGLRLTVRLRLVHALVRTHLLAKPDWDREAWGPPISVADTIATGLGGFLLVPKRALEDLGVRYTPAELEAQFHLWRWITHLLGAPEEHLPASLEDAQAWIGCALDLDGEPHEQSPELMRALLHHGFAFTRFLPGPVGVLSRHVSAQVLGGFTRRWMGEAMADRLGVPDTPLKHAAPLLRPATIAREVLLATGALGDAHRIAEREIALVSRMMDLTRAPAQLEPERVQDEPVLRAA
ncbi:oxygenase MpaB family protein [Conexibacter sp. SYSU D00693]|uniref:oxygenase MpaB family protein n=1 Tax=Conexibacter sp. SYSU D00693 TaxID=2812560 RepID=UPI00196B2FC9|nr:oxygenase MpaB family protein [Conexibacter sp. SYSU D00693]